MPDTRTPTQHQNTYKTTSSTNTSATIPVNDNAKSNKASAQDLYKQPGSESWTSSITPSDTQSQATTTMSSTSGRSVASSTRGSSSIDSGKRALVADPRRSSIERAMDKAKNKLGRSPMGAEALPNDELDYERQRAKALEKQRRKEEYERLGLREKTKYGMPGGVSFGG